MRVAFQCDPFEELSVQTDTSLALIHEALRRELEVFFYTPRSLSWRDGLLTSEGHFLSLDSSGIKKRDWTSTTERLDSFQIIWIRQDPPFDMGYLTPTYLLETLPSSTLMINDPGGIRRAPEKLLTTHFPDFMPPTLISYHLEEASFFLKEHGSLTLKSLYSYGGRSVYRVSSPEELSQKWSSLKRSHPQEPFLCQKFLPEVYDGDKRLFLIDGCYAGGYKKLPAKGDFRSNLVLGGEAQPHKATPRDHDICEAIGPVLRDLGLFFVGIDVIGDYLIEINVTSPTGLKAYEALYTERLEQKIWDRLLRQPNLSGLNR